MGNMKRVRKHSIYHEDVGEAHPLYEYIENSSDEKYSIRRLTKMDTWQEGYLWVLAKASLTGRDAMILKHLIDLLDRENRIVIKSMAGFAQENNTSRNSLYGLFRRFEKVGFFVKEGVGVYRVNPFVILGSRAYNTSKTAKAMLQVEWENAYGYPPETNELWDSDTLLVGRTNTTSTGSNKDKGTK